MEGIALSDLASCGFIFTNEHVKAKWRVNADLGKSWRWAFDPGGCLGKVHEEIDDSMRRDR